MTQSSAATTSHKILNTLAQAIISARWVIIAVFTAIIAVAIFYLPQFKIDASADTLLVKDNKLYIRTQLANEVFSPEEFILLAYAPEQHALFSDKTFNDINKLSSQIRKLERVEAVTSILTVPLVDNADALTGGTDVSSLTWQQQRYSPQVMKELIAGHPIFTDLLINREETATAIQIVFRPNPELRALEKQITDIQAKLLEGELTEQQQAELAQLKAQADPIRQSLSEQRQKEIAEIEKIAATVSDRADTYLGGSYVVGQHLIDIIKSDLQMFGSAIALVIAIMLAVLYRSVKWVVFPILACAVSVLITMGLFGMLDMRTTVISANFIALQLILTLAVMIHLIGSYREISRDEPGLSQRERIKATLIDKLSPCFYATLTTSVGFGSLIFSGLQPVVDFGWMMLVSMLVTMSVSLLLFPALLCFVSKSAETNEFTGLQRVLERLRQWALHAPKRVSSVILLAFAVTAFGLPKLDVENSFIDYFDTDTQVHQELAFIDKQFGGSTPLDIILDIPEHVQNEQLVLSADMVNQLQLVQQAVEAFEATGSVTSLANFTALAKQLNDGMPLTEYELTSIYHLLDKQVVEQLVGAYFSAEEEQLRIAVRIQDTTKDLDRETFVKQLRQDLSTVGVDEQSYSLTNLFILYQDILSRLFDSQIKTLGIVYVVLGLVLLAIFRSVKVALIALVPNILTTLGILGIIGWLGIPLDIMTITIAAIAMGIAVDDTIHFLHAWLEGAEKSNSDEPAEAASQRAFGHTGLAIFYTTSIIAIGFSLFGFSNFLPSVYFGLLTATAMMMALVTDTTLLPALLALFVTKRKAQA
ncbi:MMPL family transporter [Alteromonas sp. ASW11-19]|uniref:MMPL family transporter n=1 Tax=Alteromonas salexigens TaxID=2982530 RepID=A0ABT2VSG7_9ALTE|nr:MMPL family transporter [Alteromonas salexigens]MCU7555863.1 MMPL family transporter [Alteromonas salexigens]